MSHPSDCEQGWLFEKGRPALISAPLEGISDVFWRGLARKFGAGITYTEMVSSDALVREIPQAFDKLRGLKRQFPVVAQIFGRLPQTMARAAALCAARGAAAIDVNLGCPVPKIVKRGWGCALMKEPELVKTIIESIRASISIPLWIKMRLGWDATHRNYVEIANLAEQHGANAIVLHGRTRAERFAGKASWKAIAKLKASIGISVIGSGDIASGADAVARFEETNCDGLMIGRAALGNPWVFREARLALQQRSDDFVPPTHEERKCVLLDHLDWYVHKRGEIRGVKEMRKHFLWYSKGMPGAKRFRDSILQVSDIHVARKEIEKFFGQDSFLPIPNKNSNLI